MEEEKENNHGLCNKGGIFDWKSHYELSRKIARQKREEKLRQRDFKRIVRKHIAEEQWRAICEEWANINNPNREDDKNEEIAE